MTEEERQLVKYFIDDLLNENENKSLDLAYMKRRLLYLPKPFQFLSFVKAIANGTDEESLDQARDLFVSDLMELAEQYEHNNGLSQNI